MPYHVGVDVGGTFTDLFAINDRDGRIVLEKADSTSDAVSGVIDAIKLSGIPPQEIETLIFGSTAITNALVERRLTPVAFLGTEGFTDTLEVRRLWREHLFGWKWDRPRSLVDHDLRFGIRGRIDWKGEEIEPLNISDVDAAVERMQQRGIRVAAVSLLFSFLNPAHEQQVRERIRATAPDIQVVLSSTVNPEIKEYERASTTVIAAALAPLAGKIMSNLEAQLSAYGVPARPQIIKSNGGITSSSSARTKPLEMARSGPAGGVASALRFSREAGIPNLIAIDIGGTTADVSVITGGEASFTQQANLEWDIPLRTAMVDVRSIGAGGGSITSLDATGRLKVGPQSAGANPGPVCYGRGGTQPTVTDAAIVAGHLDPQHFLGGRMPIYADKAREVLQATIAGPLGLPVERAACGILHLAATRMAQLIDEMTVQVGLDPRDYTLVGFGGGGPLFLSALVTETEAAAGIVPLYPAVWSAFGGLFADVVHDYAKSCLAKVESIDLDLLNGVCAELRELATADLSRDGYSLIDAAFRFKLDLRYEGQSHEISVPLADAPPFGRDSLAAARVRFDAAHLQIFSHQRSDPCQLVTVRLSASVRRKLAIPAVSVAEAPQHLPMEEAEVWFHGHDRPLSTKVIARGQLGRGSRIAGPAIIIEPQAHCIVPLGLEAAIGSSGEILIRRTAA
ncbi:hydantoinase/oxoprolinase family protein [Aestuariivirga sp.]|uniref:hydantoinase/oxoprolinase family protein n=1 Tax=Aestuariivirga sp. TaxID=2650926 RepID=UPI00391DBA43